MQSFDEPVQYFRVNVTGTLNVLDAMNAEAQRTGRMLRLVFASTCAVYGVPETQPITEAQEPMPGNPYGASKLAAEAAIGYQAALGRISAVTLRTFNVAVRGGRPWRPRYLADHPQDALGRRGPGGPSHR